MKVSPFPNIKCNNHEITGRNQLIIIWTRNIDKSRTKNGIKRRTHIDKSRRTNEIRCKKIIIEVKHGMESVEEDTLIEVGQRTKSNAKETTLIIEGCIKKSIKVLEGISYS